jgi:hypothetical protein
VRIHPTSIVDNEMRRKLICIGCLETETPACSAFDVYSALLCVKPKLLLKVDGIHSKTQNGMADNAKKPVDEAFSLYSPSFSITKRTLAAPGIDEKLRSAGYLLRENEVLSTAQALASHGKLSRDLLGVLGQQALSRQIYDDLFKLSLMKLNEPQTLGRLAQTERMKSETLKSLSTGVPELRRFQGDLAAINQELVNRRNGLADAILNEIQKAEGDSICVLCGLSEKAWIIQYLSRASHSAKVETLEYWQATTA